MRHTRRGSITDESDKTPTIPTRTKMDVLDGFDYTDVGDRPGTGVADSHCGTTTCAQSGA